MSFFYGLKQAVSQIRGKRLIVIVYECLRGPFMVLLLRRNLVKENVAAAKKIGQRERECFKTTYL